MKYPICLLLLHWATFQVQGQKEYSNSFNALVKKVDTLELKFNRLESNVTLGFIQQNLRFDAQDKRFDQQDKHFQELKNLLIQPQKAENVLPQLKVSIHQRDGYKVINDSSFRKLMLYREGKRILSIGDDYEGKPGGWVYFYNSYNKPSAFIGVNYGQAGAIKIYDPASDVKPQTQEVLYLGSSERGIGDLAIPYVINSSDTFLKVGTLIIRDENGRNYVESRGNMYDSKVVGVLSNVISRTGETNKAIDAYIGVSGVTRVRVIIDKETNESIKVGDLLVSSYISGVAMKGKLTHKQLQGAVVGKALESFSRQNEEGVILMLIMLR